MAGREMVMAWLARAPSFAAAQSSRQDDGTLQADGERSGAVGGPIAFERRPGGKAAQGGQCAKREIGAVVEGQDVIVPGQAHEVAFRARAGAKGGGSGIDQAAQHASERRLSAGSRALDQEDGIRTDGTKGRNEPGKGGRWKDREGRRYVGGPGGRR